MRHHGLRRANKPWQTASDIHYPLVDMQISKLVPHYFQQLYATEVIAQFVPYQGEALQHALPASHWFDWQLKQNSNLEREIISLIDYMCMNGRAVMKAVWDPSRGEIEHCAIDPFQLIVPALTTELDRADRLVHVQVYTPDQFRRIYPEIDPLKVKTLISGGGSEEKGDSQVEGERLRREGITELKNHIIVWETWQQFKEGWRYSEWCPSDFRLTLKDETINPYKQLPFVDFCYEIKDKSTWYSPRGIAEKVAFAEAEMCNILNQKNDAMSLYNAPLFTSGREIVNTGNLKFRPAQILPHDLKPVNMPQPPISFDVHIQMFREIAENLIASPDYGLNRTLDNSQRRTAREIDAVSNLFQQNNDLRLRIFRMALGKLLRHDWQILLEHKKKDLEYWYRDSVERLPEDAMADQYRVEPSGSADGVNKAYLEQKAQQRFQLLMNHPYVDQGENVKAFIEVQDPALVRRLYRDPETHGVNQAEQQIIECMVAITGFPIATKAADDDYAHLQALIAFLQTNPVENPEVVANLQKHALEHFERLKKINPEKAKEIEAQFKELQAQQEQAQGGMDEQTAAQA